MGEQQLEIIEDAPGEVVIGEGGPIDMPALVDKVDAELPLTELYRKLEPRLTKRASADVVSVLSDADFRVAQARKPKPAQPGLFGEDLDEALGEGESLPNFEVAFSTSSDVALAASALTRISQVVVHERFDRSAGPEALDLYDIALIKLAQPSLGPVAELALSGDLEPEDPLNVTAYGPETVGGQVGIRRTGSVTVSATWHSEFTVNAKLGSELCRGDSGGGAFESGAGRLIGVISRGVHPDWSCDSETILTHVEAHQVWILQRLSELERTHPQAGSGCSLSTAGKVAYAGYGWIGALIAAVVVRHRCAGRAASSLARRYNFARTAGERLSRFGVSLRRGEICAVFGFNRGAHQTLNARDASTDGRAELGCHGLELRRVAVWPPFPPVT